MPFVSVGEAVNILKEKHGVEIGRRKLADYFYSGKVKIPTTILAGRRFINTSDMDALANALRQIVPHVYA